MGNRTETDNMLFDLWRGERSEQALDKLIRRYAQKVYAFVLYLTGSDENTAYTIAAESFMDALAETPEQGGGTVAQRLFARALEKCRGVETVPTFDLIGIVHTTEQRRNILRSAKEALMALAFDPKALLLLRDQVNLSYEEMARMFNGNAYDIKMRTWQARNQFRDKVAELLDR